MCGSWIAAWLDRAGFLGMLPEVLIALELARVAELFYYGWGARAGRWSMLDPEPGGCAELDAGSWCRVWMELGARRSWVEVIQIMHVDNGRGMRLHLGLTVIWPIDPDVLHCWECSPLAQSVPRFALPVWG